VILKLDFKLAVSCKSVLKVHSTITADILLLFVIITFRNERVLT